MKLQKLYSYTRKAIDDFQMIKENDSIAVGISGGKDSLTLLYALAGLRKFYPMHYSLTAVTVDLGYPDFDLTANQRIMSETGCAISYYFHRNRCNYKGTEQKEQSLLSLCKASQRCIESGCH